MGNGAVLCDGVLRMIAGVAGTIIVARELVGSPHRPARLRSSRKSAGTVCLTNRDCLYWGRFAAQRDGAAIRQAPSPQVLLWLQNPEGQ
ncbi:hypothetical protein FFH90_017315 [Pseudomonas sp. ATCC 43928]|nr:hypothetical protein FFH90_017315 [Pseudomonas sp. ATCC 43928]